MMASVTESGHTTEPEKYFDPWQMDSVHTTKVLAKGSIK